ncbi:MAG TPA: S41 family peptidase [Bacteroidales bacterium]|nr:S41 family peptidase [Bacteroidales bacterium]
MLYKKLYTSIFLGLCLLICSSSITVTAQTTDDFLLNQQKMSRFLQFLKYFYVDSVDFNKIVEKGTIEMLKELDPHSIYISKSDVTRTNEPLQGNFEGVGIQFQIIKDTIIVVQPIKGGPSEKVGILAGDKILTIDDSLAVGKICTNEWVFKKLRGPKNTKVKISIKRGKEDKPLVFTIIRDKIPINCIDAYFMIDKETGYIKLERFSQTTKEEFQSAINELKAGGMQHLIFDLRGNSGGYLSAAIDMLEQFIESNKLVVYTQNNQTQNKITYNTKGNGSFQTGKLVILIDEYSASASEIVSGAVQDWDRGIIVGRRSFGKGLVQTPTMLPDSSVIRLTTSRYYIPSGRCIQKPYEGIEDYGRDLIKRYNSGELTHADSIHFPDSLKYYTENKRVVYGGGGIMPDIFIPMDTIKVSDYYWQLFRNNIFNQFVLRYLESEKENILNRYPTFETFNEHFIIDSSFLKDFYAYAYKENVKDTVLFDFGSLLNNFSKQYKDSLNTLYPTFNSFGQDTTIQTMIEKYIKEEMDIYTRRQENFDTEKYIKRQIKTLIARSLYDSNKSAKIWLEDDDTYQKAIEIINNTAMFKKMKIDF